MSEFTPEEKRRVAPIRERVLKTMSDGLWRKPEEIVNLVGHKDWETVKRRMRELRDPKYGGYDVQKKNLGEGHHVYRLALPAPQPDLPGLPV